MFTLTNQANTLKDYIQNRIYCISKQEKRKKEKQLAQITTLNFNNINPINIARCDALMQ